MKAAPIPAEEQKRSAALAAAELVESGMVVGLGSGSTARYLIEEIGRRIVGGGLPGVRGVASSLASERLAHRSGIPLIELPGGGVDLAIDGMDEVDEHLRAIKGLGGALTREKIVAESAARFVLIGDASKRVGQLAEQTPVPVEVLQFGWRRTSRLLAELGLEPEPRLDGDELFKSDNANPVLDCRLTLPTDLELLAQRITLLPGVVEHGLFLDQADEAFIAGERGVEELTRRR
jgi:ribose 5-phosphate isomerase A